MGWSYQQQLYIEPEPKAELLLSPQKEVTEIQGPEGPDSLSSNAPIAGHLF